MRPECTNRAAGVSITTAANLVPRWRFSFSRHRVRQRIAHQPPVHAQLSGHSLNRPGSMLVLAQDVLEQQPAVGRVNGHLDRPGTQDPEPGDEELGRVAKVQHDEVAVPERSALDEHGRHGAAASLHPRLEHDPLAVARRVRLEVGDLGLEQDLPEEGVDSGLLEGGDLRSRSSW